MCMCFARVAARCSGRHSRRGDVGDAPLPPHTHRTFSSTVPFPVPIPSPQLQSLIVGLTRNPEPRQWPIASHAARNASSTERQHVWRRAGAHAQNRDRSGFIYIILGCHVRITIEAESRAQAQGPHDTIFIGH